MATDYLAYITSQYRGCVKFNALVDMLTIPFAQGAELALGMAALFDLNSAVGDQLDVVGEWVGVSRLVRVPLGIFFSFNTAGLGFNQGVWKGPHQPDAGVQFLDDDTYRLLIKTAIKFNYWDGTLKQYQEILQTAFPDNTIYAVDNFNMSITIHVTGPTLTPIMSALLQSGELSELRPAGVSIASYVLPP